jgi:hypothetical protein
MDDKRTHKAKLSTRLGNKNECSETVRMKTRVRETFLHAQHSTETHTPIDQGLSIVVDRQYDRQVNFPMSLVFVSYSKRGKDNHEGPYGMASQRLEWLPSLDGL